MPDKARQEQSTVTPGPCPIDPETNQPICPTPTQIDVIKVKKVFQECMHTQVEEVVITNFTTGQTTQANTAECVSTTATNISHTTSGELVTVNYDLEVCVRVPMDTGGYEEQCQTVTGISQTFRLSRADEPDLEPQFHIFPEDLLCFISSRDPATNGVEQVSCCVGVLILIQLEAEVQLMVPSYGYPPLPPECEQMLGQCPATFTPNWPPYPEQTGPFNGDNNNNDSNCNG